MDKTYTFKEASQLIKTYSRILNQLVSSKDNIEKYKKRIFNDATFFLKKFYFQNNELADFKSGMATKSKLYEVEALIKDMYYYFSSIDFSLRCEKIYNNYGEDINNNIAKLQKGKNIVRWIFSSNISREESENSYTYLKEMLNSEFFNESNNVLNGIQMLESTDSSDVYHDVSQRLDEYRSVLFELYPDITRSGYNTGAIENIKKEFDTIINIKNRITEDINNEKNEVKKQLDVLISIEMMNVLRSIPVEELNRDRRGIRTKSLRDFGCKNIADVYTRTIGQLESIQGISYAAATNIHNIACEFAREAANNVKIKLNVDNKEPATTKIVKQLNKYTIDY